MTCCRLRCTNHLRNAGAALVSAALWVCAAQADEMRACVDAQFSALGVAGAQNYLSEFSDASLPKLTDKSAAQWCRALGLRHADLQAHWPAAKGDLVLSDGQHDATLTRALALSRKRFADDWGVPLAGRIVVIGAGDEAALNALFAQARMALGQAPGRVRAERFCGKHRAGAFATPGVIGVCWPGAARAVTIGGLLPTIGHELMHQVQYELVPDVRILLPNGNRDRLLGPGWLIEGSAEIIEAKVQGKSPDATGAVFFDLQSPARRSRLTLSDLEASNAVKEAEAYGVARFAALLLARKHGTAALFDYFAQLGLTQDRALAFRAAFGQSAAEFEAEFEALRRDFAAAQAYGQDAQRGEDGD